MSFVCRLGLVCYITSWALGMLWVWGAMGGVGIDWHINYTKSYADTVGKDQFFLFRHIQQNNRGKQLGHYIMKDLPQEKYLRNRNRFSVFAYPYNKHERGWENSRQLCKPVTKSRVCITASNSPNPQSVYIRLCKHRKKFSFAFIKYFSQKKRKTLCFIWH